MRLSDYLTLAGAAAGCVCLRPLLRKHRRLDIPCLMLWAVLTAYFTFFSRAEIRLPIDWIPFRNYTLSSWLNSGGFVMNVLLFVPLGMALRNHGMKRRHAVLTGALLSLAIETAQFLGHRGQPEVNDLIANTLGALIGAAVLKPKVRYAVIRV